MKTTTHPRAVASTDPQRLALRMADSGEVLLYGDLVADADRLAHIFAAMGVNQGDTIACLLPNGPDLWRVAWAAKNSGLRYVMIGTRLNAADTGFIVRDCGARVLVSSLVFVDRIKEAGLIEGEAGVLFTDGSFIGGDDLRHLMVAQPATAIAEARRGASMLYSSGTTGRPKGVKVSLSDVPPDQPPPRHDFLMRSFALGPETVFATTAPFYHAGPLRIAMAVHRSGGTVIAAHKFDAQAMLETLANHRVTHAFFVPTMFQRMLDLPEAVRTRYDLSALRHAIHGAAPCPPHVKRAMIDWWGPVIDEIYGGTESIGQTFISSMEWLAHPGSVGRPSGQIEAKIVDAEGQRLGAGETGRVMMRNPMRFEYHGAAADGATAIFDAEGFASLGDIGHLDADGYLYLTDRESNMIISGGVNIYPQEAETVLHAHPAVADVAVIGVADRDLGEAAKALVVLAEGVPASPETAAAILRHCAETLSRYKCPRSLEFVDALPRNELGKLVKRLIPEDLCARPGRF